MLQKRNSIIHITVLICQINSIYGISMVSFITAMLQCNLKLRDNRVIMWRVSQSNLENEGTCIVIIWGVS